MAIFAGGPSLDQTEISEVRRRGWASIAINNAFQLASWADALLAADGPWWRKYPEALKFEGVKIHCQKFDRIDGVHYLPVTLSSGNSAMHAALLAKNCKARRVVLFGVDLRDDELTHWHGSHRPGLNQLTAHLFKVYRANWGRLAQGPLKGLEVINCNPRSAVTCFPRIPLEAVPE